MGRWVLRGVAGLATVVALLYILGSRIPRDHVASAILEVHDSPPEAVWAVLDTPREYPSWRKAVSEVRLLTPAAGRKRWQEKSRFGTITFTQVEASPPAHMVVVIADAGQGFGGSWTYEIQATNGGSFVAIAEKGYVDSPFFRLISRYVTGYDATMLQFLEELSARLGEEAVPVGIDPDAPG
ncbi:MAG: SRPBCC family protein [Anaerolineae bacterium]